MTSVPGCGMDCQLAHQLLRAYGVGVLLVLLAAFGIVLAVRRYGVKAVLRAFSPLAVALTLVGCIGPQGGSIFGGTVDWGDYRAPGSSRAAVAAQVATVSGSGVASATTELDSALAALERLYTSAGLRPCADAQTLRQRAWCDPPPLSPLDERWWATYYASFASWLYRPVLPCEERRRNDTAVLRSGRVVETQELAAAGVGEDGCELGQMVPNPQSQGEAARADHQYNPRFELAQCHGAPDSLRGLQLLAERGSVVAPYVGTGGRNDERLSLLVNDCLLGTRGADVTRAMGGGGSTAASCSVSGWSSAPLPSTCDTWVQAGPAPGCCWQAVWAPRLGLHVRCARSCDGVPDIIPPPGTIVICPNEECSSEERASGSCPADCSAEPPPDPEPPTDKCMAAVDDFGAILDALAEQARTVGRECRP